MGLYTLGLTAIHWRRMQVTEKKLIEKQIDSAKIKMVIVSDGLMKIGVGDELVTGSVSELCPAGRGKRGS